VIANERSGGVNTPQSDYTAVAATIHNQQNRKIDAPLAASPWAVSRLHLDRLSATKFKKIDCHGNSAGESVLMR